MFIVETRQLNQLVCVILTMCLLQCRLTLRFLRTLASTTLNSKRNSLTSRVHDPGKRGLQSNAEDLVIISSGVDSTLLGQKLNHCDHNYLSNTD